MPQMLNCEPIEISICRDKITSVMPTAATSTGALATSLSRKCSGLKNAGATKASATNTRTKTAPTANDRMWRDRNTDWVSVAVDIFLVRKEEWKHRGTEDTKFLT